MHPPQRILGPAHLPQGQKLTDEQPVFLMLNMLLRHLCWTSQTWGRTLSEEGTSSRIVLKVLAAAVAPEGTMAWMSHNFWPLLRSTPVRNRMQSRANSAGSFDSTCDWWIIPFFPCYQFARNLQCLVRIFFDRTLLRVEHYYCHILHVWFLVAPWTTSTVLPGFTSRLRVMTRRTIPSLRFIDFRARILMRIGYIPDCQPPHCDGRCSMHHWRVVVSFLVLLL